MNAEERFEAWAERYSRGVHPVTAKAAWLACEAARDAEIERVANKLDDLGDHRPAHICKVSDAYYSAAKIVRSLRSLPAQPKEGDR